MPHLEWVDCRFPSDGMPLSRGQRVRELGKEFWRGDRRAAALRLAGICRSWRYLKMSQWDRFAGTHQTGRFLITSGIFRCSWGYKYKGTPLKESRRSQQNTSTLRAR